MNAQGRSSAFYAPKMVHELYSFCPDSPNSSTNNSVLYLLGDLLLIINAPPSVFKCDCYNHVPFKLMKFLQQCANVNQVMAHVSPSKKKMFLRNVDQRVKM